MTKIAVTKFEEIEGVPNF